MLPSACTPEPHPAPSSSSSSSNSATAQDTLRHECCTTGADPPGQGLGHTASAEARSKCKARLTHVLVARVEGPTAHLVLHLAALPLAARSCPPTASAVLPVLRLGVSRLGGALYVVVSARCQCCHEARGRQGGGHGRAGAGTLCQSRIEHEDVQKLKALHSTSGYLLTHAIDICLAQLSPGCVGRTFL